MSNCYVRLVGGIGNQLFQAAAGYGYCREHGKTLVLDHSHWTAGQGHHPAKYKDTVFKNFKYSNYKLGNVSILHEQRFNHDAIPYRKGNVQITGYFQSLKYFEEYADDFKSLLNLESNKPFRDKYLAIHMRRGDYLRHSMHHLCDLNYFVNALKEFPEISSENIHIYTDSPELVSKEIVNTPLEGGLVVDGEEVETLINMSGYSNMIASNSSFSWWASFLGVGGKKIIVPDRWFNEFEPHDDIYRGDFIKIKV